MQSGLWFLQHWTATKPGDLIFNRKCGSRKTQPKGRLNPAENPTQGNTQPRKIQPRENSTQGIFNPEEHSTQGKTQPRGKPNPGENSTQGKTQPRGRLNPVEDSTQGKIQPRGLSRVLGLIIVVSKVLDHRSVEAREQITGSSLQLVLTRWQFSPSWLDILVK